ncbi:MAG TPA: pyrroline-5-carboxylate reductase [Solirubrobacteraceae bacterium]|nr:pyrroline-5-carboxylate reductase [Solirubrobacteraceae bacterium]
MQIGLIGAGNMARAMARGWGEPVLCSDAGSGRAAELVAELGGEAVPSLEVARRADLVVLCHKPAQLEQVAGEIAGVATCVVSVLGATTTTRVQAAYPDTPVFVLIPNTPVEVRRGLIAYAERGPGAADSPDRRLEARVLELFGRLGRVVRIPDKLVDAATSISGVGPAYLALLAEAQIDAAVRHSVPAALAAELVVETIAGSAALLAQRGYDTLAVRREVTSPGGSTSRGLAALERGGVRAAFHAAMDASVTPAAGRS